MVPFGDKFWRSPDLVAQLLVFLDVSSTLALAKVLPLALDLLQLKFIWADLLKRSNIIQDKQLEVQEAWDRQLAKNKREVAQLVAILKMVEDPEPLLQELLDTICEIFPNEPGVVISITVSCSRHPHHVVCSDGIQLLELAEGMMGTTMQHIKELTVDGIDDESDGNFEQALAARLSRQTEELELVEMTLGSAFISANGGVNAMLLQKSETWGLFDICFLSGDFEEESWNWLVTGMQRNKNQIMEIHINKSVIAKAKIEDLKAVWEATHEEFGRWNICSEVHENWGFAANEDYECLKRQEEEDFEGEDSGWRRIEEIWHMDKNEKEN